MVLPTSKPMQQVQIIQSRPIKLNMQHFNLWSFFRSFLDNISRWIHPHESSGTHRTEWTGKHTTTQNFSPPNQFSRQSINNISVLKEFCCWVFFFMIHFLGQKLLLSVQPYPVVGNVVHTVSWAIKLL